MHHNPTSTRSLKAHFQSIPDPRTGPAQRHERLDILMIAVCSMLCGAETFAEMELFGQCQWAWLKTWLALPCGVPSHDTFHRVFGLIDPHAFRDCFIAWTQSLRRAIAEEIIAVGGKTRPTNAECEPSRKRRDGMPIT